MLATMVNAFREHSSKMSPAAQGLPPSEGLENVGLDILAKRGFELQRSQLLVVWSCSAAFGVDSSSPRKAMTEDVLLKKARGAMMVSKVCFIDQCMSSGTSSCVPSAVADAHTILEDT